MNDLSQKTHETNYATNNENSKQNIPIVKDEQSKSQDIGLYGIIRIAIAGIVIIFIARIFYNYEVSIKSSIERASFDSIQTSMNQAPPAKSTTNTPPTQNRADEFLAAASNVDKQSSKIIQSPPSDLTPAPNQKDQAIESPKNPPKSPPVIAPLNSTKYSSTLQTPKHVIGDTYIIEVVNPNNGKPGIVTERRIVSVDESKIVIQSKSLSSKQGTVRVLEYTPEWNLILSRSSSGEELDYSPPLKYFDFPLFIGKSWQQTSTETNTKTGTQRQFIVKATITNWESITVASGTYSGLKISSTTEVLDPLTGLKTTGTDTTWYVPELRKSILSKTTQTNSNGLSEEEVIQLLNYKIEN